MLMCVAGRKVEFSPRALEPVRTPLPLRMSRRIGLRTIHGSGEVVSVLLTVSVNSSTRGTTDTTYSPGIYSLPINAIRSVTATPNAGYYFDHWLLDGVNVGSSNPYIITMNKNHSLEAMFGTMAQWFINPGFETGDLTGWNESGGLGVESTYVHSGRYAFQAGVGLSTGLGQTFNNVPVNQVIAFGFYISMNGTDDIINWSGTVSQVAVTLKSYGPYYVGCPRNSGAAGNWVYVDLLPSLASHTTDQITTFDYVNFSDSPLTANPDYLDDFTLLTESFP